MPGLSGQCSTALAEHVRGVLMVGQENTEMSWTLCAERSEWCSIEVLDKEKRSTVPCSALYVRPGVLMMQCNVARRCSKVGQPWLSSVGGGRGPNDGAGHPGFLSS